MQKRIVRRPTGLWLETLSSATVPACSHGTGSPLRFPLRSPHSSAGTQILSVTVKTVCSPSFRLTRTHFRSSIFHHTLRPLTTHHTYIAGRVSSVSSLKTEMEFYKSPLSCSRSFNKEYRRRVRSLATAVCSAAFVPTSSTFSLARVTAVYSRFRCSMI